MECVRFCSKRPFLGDSRFGGIPGATLPGEKSPGDLKSIYSREGAPCRSICLRVGRDPRVAERFREEFNNSGVVFPELRSEFRQNPQAVYVDPKTTTPLSYLVADGSFDALLKNYPETDIVISLIGLPVNLNRLESWVRSGRPSFALLLPDLHIVGDPAAVKQAMQSSKIVAAVLNKPRAPAETEAEGKDFRRSSTSGFWCLPAKTLISSLQPTQGFLIVIRV